MGVHSDKPEATEALQIADDLLNLMAEESPIYHPQDREPYQSPDMAYFRVTGSDGETYYVQVSKRKRS